MDDTYGTNMPDPVKIERMMRARTQRMDDSIARMNAMDTGAKVKVTVKGTGLAARVLYKDGYLIKEAPKREKTQFAMLKKEYGLLADERRECRNRLTRIEKEMLRIDIVLGVDHS